VGYGLWGDTFTQAGLEHAYKTMANVTDTTATINVYDDNGNITQKTVTRQPVIVLLSDGVPSIVSTDYMDPTEGAIYGIGQQDEPVFGYYTVLSANYFKNLISIHYGKVADMYTIGLGIDPDTAYDRYYTSTYNDAYNGYINSAAYENGYYTKEEADEWAKQNAVTTGNKHYETEMYAAAFLNPTAANLSKIASSSVYGSFTSLLTSSGSYTYRYSKTHWSYVSGAR
jgi:hypothetical protein